ncbi:ABC transporter substrate-binding protein [bacterium]|nr:ABC transporter substrate-binding protein [bacterium]
MEESAVRDTTISEPSTAAVHVETESGSGVALMLAFAWMNDPAALSFERAFAFAMNREGLGGHVTIVRPGSPFEAASACDSLTASDGPLLLVFVGDEGSAAAVTLRSAESGMPLLKVTADQRAYTSFGPRIFEFLPSGRMQAAAMGRFAARELELKHLMVLAPNDAKGRAHAEGFREAVDRLGPDVEILRFYPAQATSVRNEVADIFAGQSRTERGGLPLQSALSPNERTAMFGNPSSGEVLFGAADSEDTADSIEPEGFFFVLSPERVEMFSSQLPRLPAGTTLLGNSSWLNPDALARWTSLTNGMYIVAPLLPQGKDTVTILGDFEIAQGRAAEAWELLGLDAGTFTARLMKRQPQTRGEIARLIPALTPFVGSAVEVDFSKGNENRAARILQYEYGELREIR